MADEGEGIKQERSFGVGEVERHLVIPGLELRERVLGWRYIFSSYHHIYAL